MQPPDYLFSQQNESIKATLFALSKIILQQNENIVQTWKYGMPFFCYQGKMFCYLWVHKKYQQPYIGIIEGKWFDEPYLLQESRSRIKIMLFNPDEDLPLKMIEYIIQKAIGLYKNGQVKIKI